MPWSRALIRSDLEFGSFLWSGTSRYNIPCLEGVQRRATKFNMHYPDMDYGERLCASIDTHDGYWSFFVLQVLLSSTKWDHASCTRTYKHNGDWLLDAKASVSVWFHGWSSGLGVCLARRRSWVRFPRRQIPRFFFLSGYLLCGSRLMLPKLNCNTLGWKTVPFIFLQVLQRCLWSWLQEVCKIL